MYTRGLGNLVTRTVSDPTGKGESLFCQDQNLPELLMCLGMNSDSSVHGCKVGGSGKVHLGDSESEGIWGGGGDGGGDAKSSQFYTVC